SSRANTSCTTCEWRAASAGNAARRSLSSAAGWKRAGGALALPPPPPGEALLQGGGGEHATAPEHLLQLALLRWRRLEVLLVGVACGLQGGSGLLHTDACCLTG